MLLYKTLLLMTFGTTLVYAESDLKKKPFFLFRDKFSFLNYKRYIGIFYGKSVVSSMITGVACIVNTALQGNKCGFLSCKFCFLRSIPGVIPFVYRSYSYGNICGCILWIISSSVSYILSQI